MTISDVTALNSFKHGKSIDKRLNDHKQINYIDIGEFKINKSVYQEKI